MKRLSIIICTMLALSSFMATARADSPHFIKSTANLDTKTGDYCISFKEAGLGNTPIDYTVSADVDFTFQCFTKSNNEPQGAPNHISLSDLETHATITPRNGQVTASLCLHPEKDGASCQGNGLVLKLIHVDYKNVQLCDDTNGVCVSAANAAADVSPPVRN